MINITELKKMLLSEVEEKKDLPGNQEKIAGAAEPKDKITAADFAALRAKKGMKKEMDHSAIADKKIDASEKAFLQKIYKDVPVEKVPEKHRWALEMNEDHEVSMAHNSLESIIKSAMELKAKLGNDERNIPGWIQDHITNAENYIDQASQGFHELSHDDQEETDYDELPDGTEEEPVDDMHNMSLAGLMENLMEATGWKSKDPHDKAKVKKVDGKFEVYTTQDGEIKTFKTEDEAKKFADKYNSKKIDEAKKPKKWIQKAIHPSKEGSLRKALGVKKGETIPAGKLAAAAKKGGKLGQRARLAQTLKKINK